MKRFFRKLTPPDNWRIPVIILAGFITGFALYILNISKAASYLSDNPQACVNCHIMTPQYATWSHSSHREVTNCNDCHVPHNNFLNKYYFKAKDGLRHAMVFTLRKEPQVIMVRDQDGKEVIHDNCIRCHSSLINNNYVFMVTGKYCCFDTKRYCWDCHREVPHGRVNSLASVPYARVPLPATPVPDWLKKPASK